MRLEDSGPVRHFIDVTKTIPYSVVLLYARILIFEDTRTNKSESALTSRVACELAFFWQLCTCHDRAIFMTCITSKLSMIEILCFWQAKFEGELSAGESPKAEALRSNKWLCLLEHRRATMRRSKRPYFVQSAARFVKSQLRALNPTRRARSFSSVRMFVMFSAS